MKQHAETVETVGHFLKQLIDWEERSARWLLLLLGLKFSRTQGPLQIFLGMVEAHLFDTSHCIYTFKHIHKYIDIDLHINIKYI